MSKYICIGNATWDQTFQIDEQPTNATKCFVDGFRENGGGVAATAAVAVAKLGMHSIFIGRLGEDFVGDRILDDLKVNGVNTELCIIYEQAKSSIANIILNKDRSSKIYVYNDRNMPRDTSRLFDVDLTGVKVVIADSTWPQGAQVLFERAKQYGILTMFRVTNIDQSHLPIMELTDICVMTAPSLLALTSDIKATRALKKAHRRIGGSIVVTQGDRGCTWLHNNEISSVNAYKVDIKNETGAGDIFLGTLAVGIGEGFSFQESIHAANKFAALSCTQVSARDITKSNIENLSI